MASTDDDRQLLSRFEPILRLTEGELFRPTRVEDYLADAALVRRRPEGPEVLAEPGTLDPERLVELASDPGDPLSLRYVQRAMGRAELRRWRARVDRQRFVGTNAAAAAGLVARLVAAVMRLSLLVRGRVPGGHAAAAAEQARAKVPRRTAHYYGRVSRDGGFTALQYWFFYPMNDWRSSFGGVNDHEADWEQITVFVVEHGGGAPHPAWVAFASHDERGADLRRRWDDPDLEVVDGHPVAYIGAGSHSAACASGDYLVRVAPDLPGWASTLLAGFARIVPWRDATGAGIGIPFIDYRRGDGVAIGPDQDLEWTSDIIDDETPWVRGYRGLWGLDTRDPLGGERAPAGPRYERDGTVRHCWRRPLTWAALDEEPPDDETAERLWAQYPARLERERAAAVERLGRARDNLRAATMAHRSGEGVLTARTRTQLTEEVRAADAAVAEVDASLERLGPGRPAPRRPADPQAHLRHRAVPLQADTVERSLAVRAWASASAGLLLAALGLLLVSGPSQIIWPAALLVVLMLAIEAVVRRRLLGFVVNLATAIAVLVGGLALIRLLLDNLRVGVGVLLLLGALVMSVQGFVGLLGRRQDERERASSGRAQSSAVETRILDPL